jgi:hypothetical protein
MMVILVGEFAAVVGIDIALEDQNSHSGNFSQYINADKRWCNNGLQVLAD